MRRWKLALFILAVITAVAGFTGLAGEAAGLAQGAFVVCVMLWLAMLVLD